MDNEQLLQRIGLMMDERLKAFKEEIVTVIAGNGAELHTQIVELEDRLTARLDRLDNHAELISGLMAAFIPTVLKLETRVTKLENGAKR